MTDNADLVQAEDELIKEFVKAMPYPDYEDMLEKLDDHMELWCEYGKNHHECCKIIYENPTNKELIIEMGKKIYGIGGMQALSANHSIITFFSPYGKSKDIRIRTQGKMIELYFQEVTPKWRA